MEKFLVCNATAKRKMTSLIVKDVRASTVVSHVAQLYAGDYLISCPVRDIEKPQFLHMKVTLKLAGGIIFFM